jgi:hypothetical protein
VISSLEIASQDIDNKANFSHGVEIRRLGGAILETDHQLFIRSMSVTGSQDIHLHCHFLLNCLSVRLGSFEQSLNGRYGAQASQRCEKMNNGLVVNYLLPGRRYTYGEG